MHCQDYLGLGTSTANVLFNTDVRVWSGKRSQPWCNTLERCTWTLACERIIQDSGFKDCQYHNGEVPLLFLVISQSL